MIVINTVINSDNNNDDTVGSIYFDMLDSLDVHPFFILMYVCMYGHHI